MSRGRDRNRTYVVTDAHDDECLLPTAGQPPSGRAVLDQILATTHVEPTATETWETYHPGVAAPIPSANPRSPGQPWHPQRPDEPRRPQLALLRDATFQGRFSDKKF